MAKMTVKQAVHAIETLNISYGMSFDEDHRARCVVKAILEQFTKEDILRISDDVTHDRFLTGLHVPYEKSVVVTDMLRRIFRVIANTDFATKSIEGKYEILTSGDVPSSTLNRRFFRLMSEDEIRATCERLGLAAEGDIDVLKSRIVDELTVRDRLL